MSHYLAAAAECDEIPPAGTEGIVTGLDGYDVHPTTVKHQDIRARLEDSLQDAMASLEIKERQAFNVRQKEAARERRAQEKAITQAERHSVLMESIRMEREARHVLSSQTTAPEGAAHTVAVAPSASISNMMMSIPVDMVPIDMFRRIRVEEERQKRMQLPQEGITGIYNTMRRPLASRGGGDDESGVPEEELLGAGNDAVPTVKTLVNDLGMGKAAVEALEAHYKAHREALADVSRVLATVEEEEALIEKRERLTRDLGRYDTLKRDPPPPPRIAPYPLQTSAREGTDDTRAQGTNPEHPIDVYHRMIREALEGERNNGPYIN